MFPNRMAVGGIRKGILDWRNGAGEKIDLFSNDLILIVLLVFIDTKCNGQPFTDFLV